MVCDPKPGLRGDFLENLQNQISGKEQEKGTLGIAPQGYTPPEEVVLQADKSAIKGILGRRGVIGTYKMLFDECTDEQLAILLQHQVQFFEALSRGEDFEKRGGGRIKMVPPKSEG